VTYWQAALTLTLVLSSLLAEAGDKAKPSASPSASPAPVIPKASPTPTPKALDPTEAYRQAVSLINRRQLKRYPEAKRLFASVPKGHDLYPDAQAYLEWITADLLVREATKEFRAGQVAPALAKLDRARKFKVLGPRAIQSVDQRRLRWTAAVGACRKGIDYVTRGKPLRAKMELRPIAEGKLKGVVREVAKAYLAQAEGKTKKVPDRERELGRKLMRLDPKLLLPPNRPKPKKSKPAKKPKNKDGWDDWDDGKSKKTKTPSKSDSDWGDDDWDDSEKAKSKTKPD
jgi:hypothetical protein